MIYKAKVSFGGVVSMEVGEVKEIADTTIAKDLLRAGYIQEVKPAEKDKPVKATSNKRTKRG